MIAAVAAETEPARVTTLELFFDLVFVFTIAELTSVLHAEPTARGVVQVFLMLGVIWWMYGGYAWLTNAVTARTTLRRLLLLGGMGGYFVMSLAIPGAFEGSGLAFGLGYLAIVAVHSILFTRATGSAARGILTLAPFNLASAGLVLLAERSAARPSTRSGRSPSPSSGSRRGFESRARSPSRRRTSSSGTVSSSSSPSASRSSRSGSARLTSMSTWHSRRSRSSGLR